MQSSSVHTNTLEPFFMFSPFFFISHFPCETISRLKPLLNIISTTPRHDWTFLDKLCVPALQLRGTQSMLVWLYCHHRRDWTLFNKLKCYHSRMLWLWRHAAHSRTATPRDPIRTFTLCMNCHRRRAFTLHRGRCPLAQANASSTLYVGLTSSLNYLGLKFSSD